MIYRQDLEILDFLDLSFEMKLCICRHLTLSLPQCSN